MGVNAQRLPKARAINIYLNRLISTACAKTTEGNNDTFALNASQHWAARHKNGENIKPVLVDPRHVLVVMTLLTESGLGYSLCRGCVANTTHWKIR